MSIPPEGSGKNFKFSELTDDEIANIAKEYQKKSPIEIPEGASYKAQSKTGYEQISYKWNDVLINTNQDGILERQVLLKLREIHGLFRGTNLGAEEQSHAQNF